jgi:hypothetical protein
MIEKSGFAKNNALSFEESPEKRSAIYNLDIANYIKWQEYGFVHYKSGKFVNKNQYFIRNKTVGALESYYNGNGSIFEEQSRESQMSQGLLESATGDRDGI